MHGRKSGPGTILTPAEEDILCTYLIYMAQRVFPLTMNVLMVYAWSLAKKYGKKVVVILKKWVLVIDGGQIFANGILE